VFVVFYFLIIRPQNKKQKEAKKMIDAVKKGDKVVTIGGVHGTIHSVKEGTVVVKVDDDCRIEFSKSAIATVVAAKTEEKPAEAVPAEKAEEEKK
jgi:preprotein translocase subunit YajC